MPSVFALSHILILATVVGLQPILHPDLSEYNAAVRGRLESAIHYFERERTLREGAALAELYGQLGMHYHAHQINEPAEVAYRNALLLTPDDFRWSYYLAFLFEETGKVELAMAQYATAIQQEPIYNPARLRLGQVALDADRPDIAEHEFRTVLAEAPDDAAALAGLGQVLADRGEHAPAIQLYERALEHQASADQVYYLLALSLRADGRTEEARSAMQQRGERIPLITDPMLAMMTARLQGSEAFVARALRALANDRIDVALNALSMAVAIDPLDLDAQVTVARTLVLAGNSTAAVQALELVLAEDPAHRLALLNLGDLMIRAGRYQDAVPLLRQVIGIGADTLSFALLADALMLDSQYDEAAYIYSELGGLEREPQSQDPDPYYYAGIALSAAGRCGESMALLTLAFSRNPPDPLRLEALARNTATCDEATPEQIGDAVAMAEALYLSFPSQQASETFAMAMAADGQFDDAVDLQGQAIFEALRDGTLGANPQLRENMQRYSSGERATRPWPAGHSIYGSTLSGLGGVTDDASEDGAPQDE